MTRIGGFMAGPPDVTVIGDRGERLDIRTGGWSHF